MKEELSLLFLISSLSLQIECFYLVVCYLNL